MRCCAIWLCILLGIASMQAAIAGTTNEVPSCYAANKLDIKLPLPDRELFVLVDQTTLFDDKLQNSITSQSRLIEISQPEKLTSGGWVYLGSVDVKRQHWLASNPYYHTIRNEWPVKVGDLVAFSLLTNMRADSLPDQRQTAKILRDIPIGADARILELDDQRETHRNPSLKNAEAGYLIWAKVEIASK